MNDAIANPRSYAFDLVEEGHLSAYDLLICCLKFMGDDSVLAMLKANELILPEEVTE